MAEGTRKTIAALDAQANADIPDNTTALVSPADVRDMIKDFIASVESPIGGMHINAGDETETTISTISVFVKAAGTTTAFVKNNLFNMPTSNRLTYIGTINVIVVVSCSISLTTPTNNQIFSIMVAKNGDATSSVSLDTVQSLKHGTGVDIGTHTVTGHFELAPNDFLEFFVANDTSTANVTIEHLNMTVDGKFI